MKHTIIPVLFFMLASIPTAAFAQGMELALNTTSVDEMIFTSKESLLRWDASAGSHPL